MVKINKRTASRFSLMLQNHPSKSLRLLTFLDVSMEEEESNPESNVDKWNELFDEYNIIGSMSRGFQQIQTSPRAFVTDKKKILYMEKALMVLVRWCRLKPNERFRLVHNGHLVNYIIPSCRQQVENSFFLSRLLAEMLCPIVQGERYAYYNHFPMSTMLAVVGGFCDAYHEEHEDDVIICKYAVAAIVDHDITRFESHVHVMLEKVFSRVWSGLRSRAEALGLPSVRNRMVEYVASMKSNEDSTYEFVAKAAIFRTVHKALEEEETNDNERLSLLNVRLRVFHEERYESPALTSSPASGGGGRLISTPCIHPQQTEGKVMYDITRHVADFVAVELPTLDEIFGDLSTISLPDLIERDHEWLNPPEAAFG